MKLFRFILLLLILAMLAQSPLAQARSFCSNASPTTLTSTLVLTSANNGQTFTNYSISTTNGPCIKISGATNVTIEQSNIGPCGTNNSSADSTGIEVIGGSGENIFDNYIHVQNLSSDGGDDHEGILVNGASDVTIQGNVLAFNESNIEINGGTSSGDVVNGNFLLNPMGPYPRGQQFQSGSGTSGVTVENNRTLSCEQSACATHTGVTGVSCLLCSNSTLSGDSFPFYALQEDAINIYGTSSANVTGNWVEGGDSPSGQGILIDAGSSGGTVTGNVLKDTGHGCIGPYGGGSVTVENNKCESLTYINSSQNGMYLYNPYSTTGTITTKNNTISILFGNSAGTFDTGCNPATTSCYFNSYGDALGGGLTLNDLGGENYDNLYPAPIGGGSGSAYEALNPIATTNPPPLIPPEPETCVANSPYSQADSTSLTLAITSPANNATVSGSITVSGTAADNVAVSSVGVSVDGGAYSLASGTAAWSFSLNTNSLTNGSHSITAKATDSSGNTATASITVTVSNAAGAMALVQDTGATGAYPPSASSLSLSFPASNTAGNLIIVSIGWGSQSLGVASVTDTRGNVYASAVGPTTWASSYSEQLFYAKNIAAGANTITIAMSGVPPVFLEARAYEYSGLNTTAPLDATAAASGNGTALNSGAATTASANDLIFGLGQSDAGTLSAGSGFTAWSVLNAGGALAESKAVSSTGSYAAAMALSATADWAMQMAAFKAVGNYSLSSLPFTSVSSTSLTANWSSNFPAETIYTAQISTGAFPNAFSGNLSSATANAFAAFKNLNPSAAYFAEVSTSTAGPFISLGSTMTAAAGSSLNDATPPTVAITSPANNAVVSGLIAVSGTAADNVGVSSVAVSVDGGPYALAADTAFWIFALNTSSLTNSTHTITALATDFADNTAIASITITVDNIPPSISIIAPENGATISSTTIISGTATDNAGVTNVAISIDNGAYALASGTAAWTYSLNTLSLINSTHSITAQATDSAGNIATSSITVKIDNSHTTVSLTYQPTPVAASLINLQSIQYALFSINVDTVNEPGFPFTQALASPVSVSMPSGNKSISGLQQDSQQSNVLYVQLSTALFAQQDFFSLNGDSLTVTVGAQTFRATGMGGGIIANLGGTVTDSSEQAGVIIQAGQITQNAQLSINTPSASLMSSGNAALTQQNLKSLDQGRDIIFSSSGSLNSATLILPITLAIPAPFTYQNAGIAYFDATTNLWQIVNNAVTGPNSIQATVTHFSLYMPVLSLPSTAPGLIGAYAFPNPAVTPNSPTIRVCLGVVSNVSVTIFDVSGRAVNSTTENESPTGNIPRVGPCAGQYAYDYVWSGSKASGVYFAVIHGHAADGSDVKAKVKFAVVK